MAMGQPAPLATGELSRSGARYQEEQTSPHTRAHRPANIHKCTHAVHTYADMDMEKHTCIRTHTYTHIHTNNAFRIPCKQELSSQDLMTRLSADTMVTGWKSVFILSLSALLYLKAGRHQWAKTIKAWHHRTWLSLLPLNHSETAYWHTNLPSSRSTSFYLHCKKLMWQRIIQMGKKKSFISNCSFIAKSPSFFKDLTRKSGILRKKKTKKNCQHLLTLNVWFTQAMNNCCIN